MRFKHVPVTDWGITHGCRPTLAAMEDLPNFAATSHEEGVTAAAQRPAIPQANRGEIVILALGACFQAVLVGFAFCLDWEPSLLCHMCSAGRGRPRGRTTPQAVHIASDPPEIRRRNQRKRAAPNRFGEQVGHSQLSLSQSSQTSHSQSPRRRSRKHRRKSSIDEDFVPQRWASTAEVSESEQELRAGVLRLQFSGWYHSCSQSDRDQVVQLIYTVSIEPDSPLLPQDNVQVVQRFIHSLMNSNDLSVQNRCWMMAVASKVYTVWLKSVSGTDRRRLTQIRQQLRNDRVHGGRQNADQVLATIQPVSLGVPKPCRWCTAHLWPFESRIRVTPCCANGNYVIPTELIPRVHPELRAMYQDPMFIKHCRRINALLSFTAIGTSPSRQQQGRGLYSLPFPSVVRMEGKSYHLMVPASIPGPLHFYFVSDPSSTTDPRLAGSKLNPVDQQQVSFMAHRVRTWIEGNHILKDALQQMSEVGTHLLSYLDVVFVLG
jgi:hypothetical protein